MKEAALLCLLHASLATAAPGPAGQEAVDWEAVARIRDEGLRRSQVMDTVWHLTDLFGPRLTNSPQERRASLWARARFEEHGLENAALEPWGEFGLGWSFERCVVEMTAPTYMPMIAIPKAWTLGLGEPVEGAPLWIVASSAEELEEHAGTLAGRVVLWGEITDVESPFEALATRHDTDSLAELDSVPEGRSSSSRNWERYRQQREVKKRLVEMMREEGAAVLLEGDGGRRNDYGVITLGSGGSVDPEEPRGVPQVVVASEHFNRIARLLERERQVTVRVDVRTTFYDEDLQGYNVVAELPGSDPELASELVMLGAHFDSWHPATGATDNAAPSAVVMEAMRILRATGLQPRRTIRVALWTGEEQGLLGSRGYVEEPLRGPRDDGAPSRARAASRRTSTSTTGAGKHPRHLPAEEHRLPPDLRVLARPLPRPGSKSRSDDPQHRRDRPPLLRCRSGCRGSSSSRTRWTTARARTTRTWTSTSA